MKGPGFSPAITIKAKFGALAPEEPSLKPSREPARHNGQTYFVTFQTAQRLPLFRNERWALLLLETLQKYQEQMDLHDFVIMHDHVHLLITPHCALERVVQLIKGGYSFQAKRAFQWKAEIWQTGFTDHRIRDLKDWTEHIAYIDKNVRSLKIDNHPFCGSQAILQPSSIPQWLKPLSPEADNGWAQAQPLQNEDH